MPFGEEGGMTPHRSVLSMMVRARACRASLRIKIEGLRTRPLLMLWTGAPGDRRKVDGASPSR
jgi:hypothetical protein